MSAPSSRPEASPSPGTLARRILAFLLRFALFYALLMAAWLAISDAYGQAYARAADAVFGSAGPNRSTRVWWVPPAEEDSLEHWGRDVAVALEFRGGLRQASTLRESFARSSRYTGYVPTAFLVALVLATPVSWRRRGLALALGLLLVHAFVALMLGIMIWEWFYQAENQMLFRMYPELNPPWKQYLHSLWEISTWVMPYFAAPTAIWLLVTFRPSDLRRLRRAAARPAPGRG